jgi:hypothetical protein
MFEWKDFFKIYLAAVICATTISALLAIAMYAGEYFACHSPCAKTEQSSAK